MGKYEVRYWSASKKQEVDIETMHTAHLVNARRKIVADLDGLMDGDEEIGGLCKVLDAMGHELLDRGLDLDGKPLTPAPVDPVPDREPF